MAAAHHPLPHARRDRGRISDKAIVSDKVIDTFVAGNTIDHANANANTT
jgi:hypothetical protein